MRYTPLDTIEPGMILARNVWGPSGQLLLKANTTLKQSYVERLYEYRFSAVYVKDYPDEPIENLIEPVKQETKVQAKAILRAVVEAAVSTTEVDYSQILSVVDDIVDQVLTHREVVYNIADIRAFDDYTFDHCVDVCVLAVMCGAELGMSRYDLLDIGTGAILHDVGKLFTPKEILTKEAALNNNEWEVVKRHPVDGFRLLRKQIPLLPAHVAFQHHERFDGSGYPRGLIDSQMLDIAKITAVADTYNAMTSDRPYRKALMPHEALPVVVRESGKTFNPDVVKAFVRIVAAYPLGTVVRLSDGSIATVVGASKETYDLRILKGPEEWRMVSINHDSNIRILKRID